MRAETLLESLGYLDETLLAQAEQPIKNKPHRLLGYLASAAALVVIAATGYLGWQRLASVGPAPLPASEEQPASDSPTSLPASEEQPASDSPTSLPASEEQPQPTEPCRLPLAPEYELARLAAGESWQGTPYLYSTAELEAVLASNLWTTDADFTTLPVFENQCYGAGARQIQLAHAEMEDEVRALAALCYDGPLEVAPDAYSMPANADPLDFLPYSVTAWGDGFRIRLTEFGRVTVSVEQDGGWKTDPSLLRSYLCREYFGLLQVPYSEAQELVNAQAAADSRYRAGRNTDVQKELFLANLLRNLETDLSTSDTLSFSFDALLQAEYLPLGDYPIISYGDALALAEQGQYFCEFDPQRYAIVWEDETPQRGELVYPQPGAYKLAMPYYRFWVRANVTPLDGDMGAECYVPLYVPAIRADYLTDLPERPD